MFLATMTVRPEVAKLSLSTISLLPASPPLFDPGKRALRRTSLETL